MALVLFIAGGFCSSAGGDQERHRFLPNPGGEGGRDSRTYTHVPFASVTFVNGKIRAAWGDGYEVVRVFIAADWEFVSDYAPGLEIPLVVVPETRRYDYIGEFVDLRTGESFLGLTPIFCRSQIDSIVAAEGPSDAAEFAPTEGCADDIVVLGCTITDTAEDCGVTVTCEGDSGTCTSCGDSDTACCKSTQVITVVSPTGKISTKVVILEEKWDCPKDVGKEKPSIPSAQ